jgi:hypothetical protein
MEQQPDKPTLQQLLDKWRADNWLERFNGRSTDEEDRTV